MLALALVVLLGTAVSVNTEKHSLTYIYTALSHDVGLPGIHQFTAMGVLDGKVIDYYDSTTKRKVPRQDWMKERLQADYWEKGTQSRQSKQQWFNVNIDILKKRMRQNDSDVHVLQWLHGCKGETREGEKKMMFVEGKDMYNYDGSDFLYFDNRHEMWVAPIDAAKETKRKWDGVQALKDYTRAYLENECIDWLSQFVEFGQKQLREASPPEVHVFARNTRVEANVILTCLATGFYPKEIILQIKRNGRVLTRKDGLVSSGPRPNEDETFQQRDWVEILRTDVSQYTCEVIHEASKMSVSRVWDHVLPPPPGSGGAGAVIGAVAGILALLAITGVVVAVLYIKGFIGPKSRHAGSIDSNSTDGSAQPLKEKAQGNGSADSLDSGVGLKGANGSDNGSDRVVAPTEAEELMVKTVA